MKRILDISAACFGLALLWPLFAVVAMVIYWEDRGPVFYRQTRVGRHSRPFRIWKFRTMVVHADSIGPPLTAGGDPRVTRIGRWLRKFKLDEFPQLLNVLSGEMSLVGPRPEVPKYVAYYTADQQQTLTVKPGITDPASLEYFCESELLEQAQDPQRKYIEEIMPAKLEINRRYLQRASIATDVAVIVCTLLRIAGLRTGGSGAKRSLPVDLTHSKSA